MSDKNPGGGDTTVRYAGYIESAHKVLIDYAKSIVNEGSIFDSPFDLTVYDPDDAFFGTGYDISSFPTLYDMFGKYVAGFDLEELYEDHSSEVLSDDSLTNSIAAQNQYLEDDLNQNVLPKLRLEMSQAGAVRTSAFFDLQAKVHMNKQKTISQYSSDLKKGAMEISHVRWARLLAWNQAIINQYANIIRTYFAAQADYVKTATELEKMDTSWSYAVLDSAQSVIAALNGAAAAKNTQTPTWAKWVSTALTVTETAAIFSGAFQKNDVQQALAGVPAPVSQIRMR